MKYFDDAALEWMREVHTAAEMEMAAEAEETSTEALASLEARIRRANVPLPPRLRQAPTV